MTDRDQELRRQAEAVARRRTEERDQLRAAMPNGVALDAILAQIKRLRRTPCSTMGFTCDGGPLDQLASLSSEIRELAAEEPGTEAWRSEVLDVLACALHLAIASGILIDVGMAEQAAKIGRRLDAIDAGGTWKQAKIDEVAADHARRQTSIEFGDDQ